MRALVWKVDGKVHLERDYPQLKISTQEILVRVQAEGVCMTDVHMVRGALDFAKPPWVLGHEIAGIVDEIGSEVTGWQVGDRVIVDPVVACGSCKHCLTGKKYLCPNGGELGTTRGSGGYGEFVAVKPGNLYRLPEELSFAEGAMMEPLNCTLGAMERVPNVVGHDVLVFGPGPAGLLFVQLAKAYGALRVTLVGTSRDRLDLGKRLGADETVLLSEGPLSEQLTGLEFGIVIEASGSPEAARDCFRYVESSGTVVLYGLSGSGEPNLQTDQIVRKDLTVVTCISAPLLWEKGIRLVLAGKVNVRDLITDTYLFEEAEEPVNEIIEGKRVVTKAMIRYPDQA
ncbi:hypothetical protein SY83_05335 [Paenibacillus swuensis]|uniref:Enoyl reductase (ER) domain-containing protein n=1 Tax=Paenibacillus swuensis TaxID=1178515 RepID=A0A172TFU9_9BACL|nr:alcohol dehydrogenase catalytic domain-containing protein [Paenibacillus swuensis]ANE45816.1 hypothetical protein SY83_05335 [Paenibacillus swuensis]